MKQLRELYKTLLANRYWQAVLIAIVCVSVHGVTIFNDYNLDDNLVTQNHRLTSKGISAIPEIYSSPYYQDDMGYSYGYRPTTLATFAIEKSLFGESATVSHSINLILYLLTCLLMLVLLALAVPQKTGIAFFATLLFTVHPIHTEVVASIKNRDEILSLFLMLSAFWLFLNAETKKSTFIKTIVVTTSILLVGLSVSSKLSAASILILLPLALKKSIQFPARVIVYIVVSLIVNTIISQRENHSLVHPAVTALLFLLIDINSSRSFRMTVSMAISRMARVTKITMGQVRATFNTAKQKLFRHTGRFWRLLKLNLRQTANVTYKLTSKATKTAWTFIFPPDVGKVVFRLWFEVHSVAIILFLLLFGGLQSVLVFLTSWHLTKLLSRNTRTWILENGIIVLILLLFSDRGKLINFILPIILFRNYLSPSNSDVKFSRGFLFLIVGFTLIAVEFFVLSPPKVGITVDVILFTIYCFTVVSALAIKAVINHGVRANVAFQLFLAIISFSIGYILIPQAGFDLIATQISPAINVALILAPLCSFKLPTNLSTGVLKLVLTVLLLIYTAHGIRKNYPVLQNATGTLIGEVNTVFKEKADWYSKEFNKSYEKNFKSIELSKANVQDTWVIPFTQYWNQAIANAMTPIEFNSDYVETTVKQIESIPANIGRPLDFVENPISPFASTPVKLGLAITNTSRLLVNLVFPAELSFYYGFNEIWVTNLLETPTIAILIVLLCIVIAGLVITYQGNLVLGTSLLMTFICLLPFSGIIEPLPGIYAPRFTYTASFFFCISISDLIYSGRSSWRSSRVIWRSVQFTGIFLLVTLGVYTTHRNLQWKNKLTLMSNDIKSVPNSAQAHNLLAHALMEDVFADNTFSDNELASAQQAAKHFVLATDIYPFFFNAWVDLARVRSLLGENNLALESNLNAYNIDSTYPPVILGIANAYEASGDVRNAILFYQKHLNVAPEDFLAYDNLARILFQEKRYEEAANICEMYLKIEPNHDGFRQNLSAIQTLLNASSQTNNLDINTP